MIDLEVFLLWLTKMLSLCSDLGLIHSVHVWQSMRKIKYLTKRVWYYPPLEHCVPVTVFASSSKQASETATRETGFTPWGMPNRLSRNGVWVLRDSYNLPSPFSQRITKKKSKNRRSKTDQQKWTKCLSTFLKVWNHNRNSGGNLEWTSRLLFLDSQPSLAGSLSSANVMENDDNQEERDDGWVTTN